MSYRSRKYCLAFLAVFLCTYHTSTAQNNTWSKPKDNTKEALKKVDKGKKKFKQWKQHVKEWGTQEEYTRHLALGAKLNSNGWSGCLYYFNKTKPASEQVYMLSFSEIMHEKQLKQQEQNAYPELGAASDFVYGKINNLYTIQLGYGKQLLLLPNVIDGNISVSSRVTGGFSLAMLKPYYLRLVYEDNTQTPVVATLEEQSYTGNEDAFLRNGNKLGASPWTKGLKEMQYVPGVFLDACAVVQPAKAEWFIQTITFGGNFAYYSKQLPTMATIKAYRWQASLYIGLAIGKRW